jgi:hypothetical protein
VIIGKLWEPLGTFPAPYYQYGLEYDRDTSSLAFAFADAAGVMQGPFLMGGVSSTLQHCAFTYDGAYVRGYVGGVELFTALASGELAQRDTQLVIGADGNPSQVFHGQLDNVRVDGRALAPSEIAADMNAGAVGGGAGP